MRSKAIKGSYWTLVGFGCEQVIRFIGNLSAAYFLMPEDFGINFYVVLLLGALQLFSDIGIHPSVVRSSRGDDPVFLDTAWTFQVIRGIFLFFLAWSIARPWAVFYDVPVLELLIPVAAFSAIIDGFASIKFISAARHLDIKRLAFLRIFSQVISLLVIIFFAWLTKSVWALVAGWLAGSVVKTILSYFFLTGHVNKFRIESDAARELIFFGGWIFVSTAMTWFASRGDGLVLGKLLSPAVLGLFYIATQIANIPFVALCQLSQNIVFPVYSQCWRDQGSLAQVFQRVRGPVVVVSAWLFSGVMAVSPVFIKGIYPESYIEAGVIAQFLVVGLWVGVLENLSGCALLSMGDSKSVAAGSFIKALFLFPGIYIGFIFYGLYGSLVAIVVSELIRYFYISFMLFKRDLFVCKRDFLFSAGVIGVGLMGSFLTEYLNFKWHFSLAIVVVGFFVTVIWSPFLIPLAKRVFVGDMGKLKSM